MTGQVLIIDPKTDGAEIRNADITVSGGWVTIDCRDIIIKIHEDDISTVTGDEGPG